MDVEALTETPLKLASSSEVKETEAESEAECSLMLVSEAAAFESSLAVEVDKVLKLSMDVENSDNEAALRLAVEAETTADSLAKACEDSLRLVIALVKAESLVVTLALTEATAEASLAKLAEAEAKLVWALVTADCSAEVEAEASLATVETLAATEALTLSD